MAQPTQQIPAGWKITKISDVCENLNNLRIPITKSERKSGNIPYYGATGIVDYVADYIFDEELLLIGEDGADWSPYANTAYLIRGKTWVNNHAHVLRCKRMNIIFLKEYLNYADLRLYTTGTTRGKLTKGVLDNIKVLLPSLPEQTRIAEILSKVDEEIEKTDQIINETDKLKKGLMQDLLTKGIGHTKFKKTELGEVPEEWEVKDLGDFSTLQRGFDLPKNSRTSGQYPLVSSNGITDTNSEYKVKAPGVVTGRSGTIGNVFYVEKDFWPLNTTLYIKDFQGNNEKFVYYALQKFNLANFLTGTGVPTLNRNIVHKEKIAVPKLYEQLKIAEILSLTDNKLSINQQIKSKLISLKKGLMNDLLGGQKRTI